MQPDISVGLRSRDRELFLIGKLQFVQEYVSAPVSPASLAPFAPTQHDGFGVCVADDGSVFVLLLSLDAVGRGLQLCRRSNDPTTTLMNTYTIRISNKHHRVIGYADKLLSRVHAARLECTRSHFYYLYILRE